MKERKPKEIDYVFTKEKEEDILNSGYSDEDKKRLILQAKRLDDEMVLQQKGGPYLQKKTGVSKSAIANYRVGSVFIKEDLIDSLCKELNVSKDYLRGISNVKKEENDTINKQIGLNDNSIDVLSTMPNKELINVVFDNRRDDVLYFYEKLAEYNRINNLYKDELKKSDINGLFAKEELKIAEFKLVEAFKDLIK